MYDLSLGFIISEEERRKIRLKELLSSNKTRILVHRKKEMVFI